MTTEKSLSKITTKYHCMVSGQKVMEPCDGCSNPKGCLSRAMQYKENEEMDELNEKAVVKIDADGGVVKCAKGLGGGECGYKAGAKVCGACGAMPVEAKGAMEAAEEVDEDYTDEVNETLKKRKKRESEMREENLGAKEMNEEEEIMPDPDMVDDEDMEEDEGKTWMMKPKKRSRARAMNAMGVKSEEFDDPDGAFLCQFERKVYPGDSDVCANCPGGCAAEQGMPGLLDVEGMVLDMFGGKVLYSGYSDEMELFIVDVLAKDGRAVEVLADGPSGEVINFHRLNAADMGSSFGEKSLDSEQAIRIVDIKSAEDIALDLLLNEFKTAGSVVAADSDIVDGYDAYIFEVDGINGKSYDVFVGVDGTGIRIDEYDATEVEEIEAEAAEIALKRAYNEESRTEMAEEGMALPDGSYPIKDETDLQNAVQAFGRAKDKEAAKRHIMKRARDLGKEDMIPENWMNDSDEKSDDAFMATLMEFQILEAEEDLKDKF
jgi:hypothetical protein